MIPVRFLQKILVIKFKHIGDVLVTTPLFRNFRIHFPEAYIAAAVFRNTAAMLTDNPDIDAIFQFDQHGSVFQKASIIASMRRQGFDLAVDLTDGDRGAWVAYFSGSPRRLGFRPKRPKFMGRQHLFTDLMDNQDCHKHATQYHLEPLRYLGLEIRTDRMRLHWTPEVEMSLDKKLASAGFIPGTPFVVVHPTSRWMFKCWTPEGYARVIDHLRLQHGIPAVVTSDRSPVEMQFVDRILSRVTVPVFHLAGVLSLKELAALISRAVLFMGVDTAPMHMAAAIGTPVVVLFGPSGDHMWGPWGDGHTVIKQGWDCQPCGSDGCDGTKISRCLETIEPDRVIHAIDSRLSPISISVNKPQIHGTEG